MIRNYVYLRCKYTTPEGICQEFCEIFSILRISRIQNILTIKILIVKFSCDFSQNFADCCRKLNSFTAFPQPGITPHYFAMFWRKGVLFLPT